MPTNATFSEFSKACVSRVEQALEQQLPGTSIEPARLHEAMRYATFNGGKRVRPILVYASGQACRGAPEALDIPACAVELIHSYSLVHDDLPAMDDDDLRRGKPTCHRAYDEATAILVGDALQSLAFRLLTHHQDQLPADTCLQMVRLLATASGSRGMAGGQAMDIDAVARELTLPELEIMHIHKTGALIRASVQMGAMAAGATEQQLLLLGHYATAVGLAFQVQDDILDITSDTDTLGKTQGKDAAANKPTYPGLLGLDGARQKAQELLDEALNALVDFGAEADQLRHLARYVVQRAH
ncbi:(2E,6E)-farnesyl diphosphate synthase [Thiolapillus brandeum]|uniref:Farnesyl diphosphate synthase n=1 Tax=Thiolapillus brandeum TaxID=1076588 RepID=A0A7U6JHB0_9GAMM|nr:farnesyl diphosphate synthase [Thiolapillus brandeum]BAO44121.1 farnesyl diphosphate synthase [Thiolapillus brandeum]